MKTLADLEPGEVGVVKSLPTGDALSIRFREMGLLPRVRVKLVRRAPLGDPVEIMVRGSLLSLRNLDAARVELEEAEAEA